MRNTIPTPLPSPPPRPILIGYRDLCALLGVSRRHLQRMVHRDELPKPRSMGARRLFVLAEVMKAIADLPPNDNQENAP